MPIHGNAPFLKLTLDSILTQRDVEYTLLAVLDRVNLDVRVLLKSYARFIDINIVSSNKEGIVDALNTGLTYCDTKLVARIDCDDLMLPQRLHRQQREFESDGELVLVGSNIQLIDENNSRLRVDYYPLTNKQIIKEFSRRNPFAHPSVMFLRDTVVEAGGYRKFYEGAEDFDLWTRLLQYGKVKNLGEVLTEYRIHPNQSTQRMGAKSQIAFEAALTSYRFRILRKAELHHIYRNIDDWSEEYKAKRNLLKSRDHVILSHELTTKPNAQSSTQISSMLSSRARTIYVLQRLMRHPFSTLRQITRQANYRILTQRQATTMKILLRIEKCRSDKTMRYFISLFCLAFINHQLFGEKLKFKITNRESAIEHNLNLHLTQLRAKSSSKRESRYFMYLVLLTAVRPTYVLKRIIKMLKIRGSSILHQRKMKKY